MKYMYICETCGKLFTDMEEAVACECSHRFVETLDTYRLDEATRQRVNSGELRLQQFGMGESLPFAIWMMAPIKDSNSNPKLDQNGYGMYEAVLYKRAPHSVNTDARATILTKALAKGMLEHHEELQRAIEEREARETAEALEEVLESDPSTDPA